MVTILATDSNGNDTNAQIAVVADSKPAALNSALTKMENHTARTGQGFSIESYTTVQVAENQYIVSVS